MGMNEEPQGVSVWTRTHPLPGSRTDKGIWYDTVWKPYSTPQSCEGWSTEVTAPVSLGRCFVQRVKASTCDLMQRVLRVFGAFVRGTHESTG